MSGASAVGSVVSELRTRRSRRCSVALPPRISSVSGRDSRMEPRTPLVEARQGALRHERRDGEDPVGAAAVRPARAAVVADGPEPFDGHPIWASPLDVLEFLGEGQDVRPPALGDGLDGVRQTGQRGDEPAQRSVVHRVGHLAFQPQDRVP